MRIYSWTIFLTGYLKTCDFQNGPVSTPCFWVGQPPVFGSETGGLTAPNKDQYQPPCFGSEIGGLTPTFSVQKISVFQFNRVLRPRSLGFLRIYIYINICRYYRVAR